MDCICASNPHCQKAGIAVYLRDVPSCGYTYGTPITMPGIRIGCFVIDSLLLSTLECLYSECCLSILYYYVNITYYYWYASISRFDTQAMVYNSTSSRFPPNSTVQMLIKDMMIEQWNSSFSSAAYYQKCAPTYCTYVDRAHLYKFGGIVIKLVSTTSAFTAALHLFTPLFVGSIFHLMKPKNKEQRQGNCLSRI